MKTNPFVRAAILFALSAAFASADPRHAAERLFADPALLAAHRAMLPQGMARKRGD